MTYQPLIIIGAGRSGTNILRDTLTTIPKWETWDCDEINLIWRHGNIDLPNDIFSGAHATPSVSRFIKKAFNAFQSKSKGDVVVEKTCANSLRIPFIDAIFPQARYVYIVRDGRDVALSAAKRWTSSVEPSYLLKKLRYAPLLDIPHYGMRFAANRIYQFRSKEKRQAAWGPIFPDMKDWVRERPLIDVCAKQWAVCVEESDKAFAAMPSEKWTKVRYEELVSDPQKHLRNICKWYGDGELFGQIPPASIGNIHAGSLNGWKKQSDQFSADALEIMAPSLERHGYEPSI